ncbi:MAG: ferritin-like fold-containing protein [Microlunatus sp.]
MSSAAAGDDGYRDGAIDLLGILAYGALTAFERLAEDAQVAPTLADKVELTTVAARQIDHFKSVSAKLDSMGVDVMAAMAPFHAPFDAFHSYTKPKDWYEGLVKAFVGDSIAADFYREIAAFVDADTRNLVHQVLADEGLQAYIVTQVRLGMEHDPKLAGRLSLWGRRLVGEALSQAQRVAVDRDALTSLLTGTVDRPGLDLAAMSRMFSRLVANHTKRMAELGLKA